MGVASSKENPIRRLTHIPETHTKQDSGDLILGQQGARAHAGKTFRRAGDPHTHGVDTRTGQRVHIPAAAGTDTRFDTDGITLSRKAARNLRYARRNMRT